MYVYMSSSMQRGWSEVRGLIWAAGWRNLEFFLIRMRPKTEVHDWYEWIKPILMYEPNDLLLRPLWHDYKRFIIITEMVKVTWPAALHQLFYFDIFERYRWGSGWSGEEGATAEPTQSMFTLIWRPHSNLNCVSMGNPPVPLLMGI